MKNLERGIHKRKGRDDRHKARIEKEFAQMLGDWKGMKIQIWDEPDKPCSRMLIRLKFRNPIIPQAYDRELRDVLEKIFNGNL